MQGPDIELTSRDDIEVNGGIHSYIDLYVLMNRIGQTQVRRSEMVEGTNVWSMKLKPQRHRAPAVTPAAAEAEVIPLPLAPNPSLRCVHNPTSPSLCHCERPEAMNSKLYHS